MTLRLIPDLQALGEEDTLELPALLCAETNINLRACTCRLCVQQSNPGDTYNANKRDVRQLLQLIGNCINDHPSLPAKGERPTWGNVADMTTLRELLVDAAVQFPLAFSEDEQVARRRIEDALALSDDAAATAALIDAM